jgi:hypothetical protein
VADPFLLQPRRERRRRFALGQLEDERPQFLARDAALDRDLADFGRRAALTITSSPMNPITTASVFWLSDAQRLTSESTPRWTSGCVDEYSVAPRIAAARRRTRSS